MMMKLECLVVLFVLFVFTIARNEALPGGWTPIKNLNDPLVTDIANYAVTEYDKRSGAKLKFVKVIKGETQVVSGILYRLVLVANDGSSDKDYQAIVLEKAWLKYRNLTSFTPVQA